MVDTSVVGLVYNHLVLEMLKMALWIPHHAERGKTSHVFMC